MRSWVKNGSESELMHLLEESRHPLRFEDILEKTQPASRKRIQRQLDRWRAQNLVDTIWMDGAVHYLAKGQSQRDDAFTPGSTFRLAVIRDRGRISFAAQPLRHQAEPHVYDRLLVVFCWIALGTLLAVAWYLFIG